ncbi:MAG TPA: hypothetical protein VME17_24810 [Bryobacteraceae bacterium]|nr:hypothetical protein [Bryobacteraceae bacterium]
MKVRMTALYRSVLTVAFAATVLSTFPLRAKDVPVAAAAPVRMTVSASVDNSKRMPDIHKDEVFVKSGKDRLPVTEWVPARGDRAGMELFILIDDASSTTLGTKIDELRKFINAQPPSTVVGLGYMRNATVQIAQNLTADHAQAAKAVRLPLGTVGAYGSPYLSAIDLMKRWPQSANRRQVILVSDGIDHAGRGRNALLNPDVDTANDLAQRTGTMIHTIYSPGVGHWRRNFWIANSGANGLAKLSGVTGGESFYLGPQSPVSFTPYLDRLQKIFDNQYLLSFDTTAGKKARFQRVNVSTEVPGIDFNAADSVWVPGSK